LGSAVWLLFFLRLAPLALAADPAALPWREGDSLQAAWTIQSIERHAEYLRLGLTRNDRRTTVEITYRRDPGGSFATKWYQVQPAPGETPDENVLAELRDRLSALESQPGHTPFVRSRSPSKQPSKNTTTTITLVVLTGGAAMLVVLGLLAWRLGLFRKISKAAVRIAPFLSRLWIHGRCFRAIWRRIAFDESSAARLGHAGGAASPLPNTFARWFGLGVIIFLILAMKRLVLRSGLAALSPEACHTGGLAEEFLRHGFSLPLFAYAPEPYEPGIVIEGILAVPYFALFGHSRLALLLLTLTISTFSALAAVALLRRLEADLGWFSPRRNALAIGAFLLLLVTSSHFFLFKSIDPLGDHNEAALCIFVILLLLFRRIENSSMKRRAALWIVAGLLNSIHMGSLLATGLAAAHEARCLRPSRKAILGLLGSAGAYLLGLTPGIWLTLNTEFSNIAFVEDKFFHAGFIESLLVQADSFFFFLDQKLAVAILIVCAWMAYGLWWFRGRGRIYVGYLAAYVFLHLAAVAFTGKIQPDYFLHAYAIWLFPIALGAAWLADRGSTRWRRFGAMGATALAIGLVMAPRLYPDWKLTAALSREGVKAVCHWRLGRAFLHYQMWTENLGSRDAAQPAAQMCRTLGGEAALACLSGIAFEGQALPDLREEEALAYAFGWGRRLGRADGRLESCAIFAEGPERTSCEAGAKLECLAYFNLFKRRLPRPDCEIPEVPFAGYMQDLRHDLMHDRPPAGQSDSWFAPRESDLVTRLFVDEMRGCGRILAECYKPRAEKPPAE